MENTPFKSLPGYVHFSLNIVNVLHLEYAIKFILKWLAMEVGMMGINLEKLA